MLVVIFNDRFQQKVLTYLKKKEEDALIHILQRATKQRWFLLVVRVFFLYLARVFRRNEAHLVAERVYRLGSLQTNYAISLQFCIVRIIVRSFASNHFAAISYDSTD